MKLLLKRFKDGVDPGKGDGGSEGMGSPHEVVTDPGDAQLVTSALSLAITAATPEEDARRYLQNCRHVPVLDIDWPCHLVESSPGKHHLLIDRSLTWPQMVLLLSVLAEIGIVEPGFAAASIARGYSSVRTSSGLPTEVTGK